MIQMQGRAWPDSHLAADHGIQYALISFTPMVT